MERDLVGYGGNPPQVVWPQNCKIAVNFVLNYEEGSESSLLDGDDQSESYLTDLPGVMPLKGERQLSVESLFEYGSRVGVWRLLALFESYDFPLTIFASALALERNPELVQKIKGSKHEIAGHGYRWISYRSMPEELEREHLQKTIHSLEALTQKKVVGWYTGRASKNTRKFVVEAGLLYDSDSYADDLPYWKEIDGRNHLIIPYNLDANDARYVMTPGWSTGEDGYRYLKATFDQLYKEGSTHPKMMTIGLHPRLSGRPGRAEAIDHFMAYIKKFDRVWICRREEIAHHWMRPL